MFGFHSHRQTAMTMRSLRPGVRARAMGPTVLTLALVAAGAAFPVQAQPPASAPRTDKAWVTRAIEAPRVAHRTFQSAAARTAMSYHLYAPAAYDRELQRRFPVVYWLHGSGGGLPGIPRMARRVDTAIEAGRIPPVLMVFVNGLEMGMYVDWRDGSAPVETVLVRELVDHLDATYRTVASREGRILDGFSMGGYGAARFGFKFPERFRAVSIMGAGPMQEELAATPRASPAQARQLLQEVYGGSQAYFRAVSPQQLAQEQASALTAGRSFAWWWAIRMRPIATTSPSTSTCSAWGSRTSGVCSRGCSTTPTPCSTRWETTIGRSTAPRWRPLRPRPPGASAFAAGLRQAYRWAVASRQIVGITAPGRGLEARDVPPGVVFNEGGVQVTDFAVAQRANMSRSVHSAPPRRRDARARPCARVWRCTRTSFHRRPPPTNDAWPPAPSPTGRSSRRSSSCRSSSGATSKWGWRRAATTPTGGTM